MSLDIYIISPEPIKKKSTGIFARIDGATRELTREEALKMFPKAEPWQITEEEVETNEFWHGNITHNLAKMADQICNCDESYSLCELLWRDEPISEGTYTYITSLVDCLGELTKDPEFFKQFNPSNGWGTYEQLVEFVRSFIHALIDMPPGSTIKYSK